MVSEKNYKFLVKNLKLKRLTQILPLYITVNSRDESIFTYLPETLTEPALISLENFQNELKVEFFENLDIDLSKNLKGVLPRELLFLYSESVKGTPIFYDEIEESIRSLAIYWLEEIYFSTTGENGFFSKDINLEKRFFDKFIEYANGIRVTSLLSKNFQGDNADYYFPNEDIIIELKIIETDFVKSQKQRLDTATDEFRKTIKITGDMILGRDKFVPDGLLKKHLDILRKPLERITNKANSQVKNTKLLLQKPKAKGLVIFLIDGFYSLSPSLIIKIIDDPIQRHFSAIDGFIFVSLRRRIIIPFINDTVGYLTFQPRLKEGISQNLDNFVTQLGTKWFDYIEDSSGRKFGFPREFGNLEIFKSAYWEKNRVKDEFFITRLSDSFPCITC